jgi:hypothetical protein
VGLEDNKKSSTKNILFTTMNRKITVIFLSTVLPTALIAGQNGLTSDILSRANSVKADSVALEGSVSGPQAMRRATASNETASLADIRGGLVADTFSSAETQLASRPSGLNASLSSGSMASTTASLADTRAGLVTDTFSSAQTQLANNPSSLNGSLTSGLTASETASLVAPRAQAIGNFSNAATQMTNVPSSLGSSPTSSSNLLQQELEQQHNAQQPESLVQ